MYPMIADLKDRKPDTMTPFVIVNFSHYLYLHLLKDHVVAIAEKDCNESEVVEICSLFLRRLLRGPSGGVGIRGDRK